jgi:hypothetical protein
MSRSNNVSSFCTYRVHAPVVHFVRGRLPSFWVTKYAFSCENHLTSLNIFTEHAYFIHIDYLCLRNLVAQSTANGYCFEPALLTVTRFIRSEIRHLLILLNFPSSGIHCEIKIAPASPLVSS